MKNEKIEISLSNLLHKELELFAAEYGTSKNELVIKAIEDFLFVRKFSNIKKKFTSKAGKHGCKTDDDIFKAVS